MASGLTRTICTGLPASTRTTCTSKLSFSGMRLDADDLDAERAQFTADGAPSVVRQHGGELLAELDGVERVGLGAPLGRQPPDDSDDGARERFDRRGRPGALRDALKRRDSGGARRGLGVRLHLARQKIERRCVGTSPAQRIERGAVLTAGPSAVLSCAAVSEKS